MKFSLNKTWEKCEKMWKDVLIILEITRDHGRGISVEAAKEIWMTLHGYENKVWNDCFFCDYTEESTKGHIVDPGVPGGCPTCPGTLVDSDFACQLSGCDWRDSPSLFSKEISRLNRKRKRLLKKKRIRK